MGEKCKPRYRNLNTIKSYSEQKYATVQWCQQNCENDEWLKQQVEMLKYLSPPAVRKWFDITKYLDEKHSYSCRGKIVEDKPRVMFDDQTIDVRFIDFRDLTNQVDIAKTDAVGENRNVQAVTNNEGIIQTESDGTIKTEEAPQQLVYCLPKTIDTYEAPAKYVDFGTMLKPDGSKERINSYWYIAWNKDKNYYIRPDWLKNWKDEDIRSVCRAQTFKAEATGQLTSIDLPLRWNGGQDKDCGSPLYVQIWNTYVEYVDKSTWDKKNRKMKYKYLHYENDLTEQEKSEIYHDKQRYTQKEVKVRYTSGAKKGKVKQKTVKKNGKSVKVDVTEIKYVKDPNGEYVRKVQAVHKPGHNKVKNKEKNTYYTDIYYPLAETVYEKVGETYPNITFDMPCTLTKGKYYAIVLFSPLSEWRKCPRWGGWGRNCRNDKMYNYGHAFMSKNNGRTWTIYGKDGADTYEGEVLDYKQGKYTPQDFGFECHVETNKYKQSVTTQNHYSENEHYLYLKPIYSNPIKNVRLYSECWGSEQTEYGYWIDFEISTDGEEWITINNQGELNIAPDSNGNQPRILLVRAKLYRDPAERYKEKSPYIENITIVLTTELSKEMYARTSYYKPITTPMLGANLWGRVFAPFSCEETVQCTAEIIQGTESNRYLNIIDVTSLDEMLYQMLHNDTEGDDDIINEFTQNNVDIVTIVNTKKNGDERAEALTDNPVVFDILEKYNIFIKPHTSTDGLTRYLLSFGTDDKRIVTRNQTTTTDTEGKEVEVLFSDFDVKGIKIDDKVAYPILSLNGITPSSEKGGTGDSLSEVLDYTFDYETNTLYLTRSTVESLVEQTLVLTYNKVFITGLTEEEVGRRIDVETDTVEDGLVLDYFKETIPITEAHVTSRRVPLRVEPTDPIRSVQLYKFDLEEGLEPKDLNEDYHYTLDLDKNELVFEINNTDGQSTVLDVGDKLEVVYTPFLTDDSLALGYYATRENVDKQCYIDNMYYEYKV